MALEGTPGLSGTWFKNKALTLKIVSFLRSSPNLWWMYGQMCRAAALGNFAEAAAIRASIIAVLEAAGVIAAGEVALPVMIVGSFFFLATTGVYSDTMPKKSSIEDAQIEYKKYMFQIDMMELNIAGVHLGPPMPRITFMQFVVSRYPKVLTPNREQVLNLKW